MPCDGTPFYPEQTLAARIKQVNKVVDDVQRGLVNGSIQVVVDKATKAIAFKGVTDGVRAKVTDVCIYRRIMASKGTAMARMKIVQAEQRAGVSVSKQAIQQGAHSHDGGVTFHSHKG